MDHHRINGGRLVPADPRLFDRAAIYDLRPVGGHYVMGKLTPTADLMRREGLLNSSTLLRPQPGPRTDAAVEAAKRFASGLRRGRPDVTALGAALAGSPYLLGTGLRLARHQWRFPPDIGRGRWSFLPNNHRRFQSFELIHQCEQAPHPANRVTLGSERDHLGLPRASVRTRWSEADVHSIRRLHEVLEGYFSASGLGHVLRRQTDQPDLHNAGGMHHHLGTTRMHPDERRGVVDLDCRVHGTANLYVASGSVFPTGGYANPNLTIAALAIRLADRVKATLAAAPTAVSL
jgi:choline dehydrogenase-like flavoprotein